YTATKTHHGSRTHLLRADLGIIASNDLRPAAELLLTLAQLVNHLALLLLSLLIVPTPQPLDHRAAVETHPAVGGGDGTAGEHQRTATADHFAAAIEQRAGGSACDELIVAGHGHHLVASIAYGRHAQGVIHESHQHAAMGDTVRVAVVGLNPEQS